MRAFACVFACVFARVFASLFAYALTYVFVCVFVRVLTCVFARVPARVYARVFARVFVRVFARVFACLCANHVIYEQIFAGSIGRTSLCFPVSTAPRSSRRTLIIIALVIIVQLFARDTRHAIVGE